MVDNLLDILSDGRHRRARYRLDQHRHVAGEERAVTFALATAVPTLAAPAVSPPDLTALRSLAEIGIDVRFVDALGKRAPDGGPVMGGGGVEDLFIEVGGGYVFLSHHNTDDNDDTDNANFPIRVWVVEVKSKYVF